MPPRIDGQLVSRESGGRRNAGRYFYWVEAAEDTGRTTAQAGWFGRGFYPEIVRDAPQL